VAVLLAEEWRTVSLLGYRPEVDGCVACGRELEGEKMSRFDFSSGGLRCGPCAPEGTGPRIGPRARTPLLALLTPGTAPPPIERPRAHLQLLSDFVTYHVSGGRPLAAFTFLGALLPRDDA